jgi:hypothetical protein
MHEKRTKRREATSLSIIYDVRFNSLWRNSWLASPS